MLEVSSAFPDHQFTVARAPAIDDAFYEPFLLNYKNVGVASGKTYDLLNEAAAALVTSGTATLEAALFGVPEVVCYKGNQISYEIAKRVIKVKYISLVNLIMNKLVVTELNSTGDDRRKLHNRVKKTVDRPTEAATITARLHCIERSAVERGKCLR